MKTDTGAIADRVIADRVIDDRRIDEELTYGDRRSPDGPVLLDVRIAVEPELHHEVGHDAEEARVVEEAILHEVVETVGAFRRPVAVHFDDEGALARVELRLELLRGLFGELRRRPQLRLRQVHTAALRKHRSRDQRHTDCHERANNHLRISFSLWRGAPPPRLTRFAA